MRRNQAVHHLQLQMFCLMVSFEFAPDFEGGRVEGQALP